MNLNQDCSLHIYSLGWSLPTGFDTPMTYFYIVYFVILLLHRQIRDDHACKQKYGEDWDKVGCHSGGRARM